MTAMKPSSNGDQCRMTGMKEMLLERERLEQALKERFSKEVTILFSDVCGYTQFTEHRGDIQSRTLLLKHNRMVLPAIETNRGKVIEIVGDGIMAAFENPVNAAHAAVTIQKELSDYNHRTPMDDQIHVKMGLHCGNVLVDEDAAYQSLTGDVANVTARIQNQAQADQILISKTVYEHLRTCNDFLIRFHGNIKVKGKQHALRVYRLVWGDLEEASGVSDKVRMQTKSDNTAKTPRTIINLDLNIDGNELKISANETQEGHKSTISRYETQPISIKQIDGRCQQLVDTLNKANRRGRVTRRVLAKLREIGQLLYDDLLTFDVKEMLRNSLADTLIVKIDDRLIHIPWELLYDGQDFFCLRFNMGRVVKTRQSVVSNIYRKLEQPLNMLILADPTGDLAGAYDEGIQIRNFMDQKPDLINVTLRSDDTNAENIKTKLRNFDLIHYAGHADFDVSCPESSGWRLHEGSLCTGDIVKMAGSATMPALIFANACQSARAEEWAIETSFESKIFGLANAFLVAGVKHYLGTFWEIPDEPSSRFAIEFYNHLFADCSVGEALRKARRALIDVYGEETIIWASYVLYGDPMFDYMRQSHTGQAVPKSKDEPGMIRSTARNRSREEIIDFAEDKKRRSAARIWVPILAVLVALSVWFFGWPWYQQRAVNQAEKQALAYYRSGDLDAAARLCEKAQQDHPGDARTALLLGKIQLSRGQYVDARHHFQTVVDSDAGSNTARSEALMGLARLASIEQRPGQALQLYRDAAAANPQSPAALKSQALILERQNRDAEALDVYQEMLQRFPNDTEIQLSAQNLRDRLAWEKDKGRQAAIDRLVSALLERYHSAPTQQPAPESQWTSKPLSIWFLALEENGHSILEGQARRIHMLIRHQLLNNQRINLVERAVLDKLLAELHLGTSDLADRQTALSIGRLMAARVLLSGQVQYENGQMLVSIRAIACETGIIRASIVESFSPPYSSMSVAQALAQRINDELMAKFPLKTVVTEVKGSEIVLDIGQRVGLENHIYFKGVDTDVLVQVNRVDAETSIATVVNGSERIAPGLRMVETTIDAS